MKGKGQSSPASPVQTFHTPTLPKGAESESLFIHSCQRHPQRIYAPKRHRVGWSRLVDTSQLPPLLGPRDGQVPLSSTLYQPEAEDSQLARKLRNHHIEVGKQTQTCGKLEPATFFVDFRGGGGGSCFSIDNLGCEGSPRSLAALHHSDSRMSGGRRNLFHWSRGDLHRRR